MSHAEGIRSPSGGDVLGIAVKLAVRYANTQQ